MVSTLIIYQYHLSWPSSFNVMIKIISNIIIIPQHFIEYTNIFSSSSS